MATRNAVTSGDAVYARYSSELQNPRSCDDQITELRQALERRGGSFDERLVFSDSEVSGGIWEREGLQALLLAVESGRVRRIFVEDLSRLSRDKEDSARIEKLLAYRDVSVVTLDGMVYDGSTGSALAFTFQSAGAAQYLKDLGAKTRRGLRGSHRDGKSTGGRCFGFAVEGLKLSRLTRQKRASYAASSRFTSKGSVTPRSPSASTPKAFRNRVPGAELAQDGCIPPSAKCSAIRSTSGNSHSANGSGSATRRLANALRASMTKPTCYATRGPSLPSSTAPRGMQSRHG
jgi:DNA invertase Pin-like site-specific DNA recombinase